MAQVTCFKCGKEVPFVERIGRKDECPSCRSDLHACRNCVHYDASVYNECRESSADTVREKDRANFCDFFSPSSRQLKAGPSAQDLKSAAEALFKKK